jgi:WS/DGAT/MGAT family acyltransferase
MMVAETGPERVDVGRELSDIETLLWGIEQNPNLISTTGAIALLDAPPDPTRLRNSIAAAVLALEPLHSRVSTSSLPFAHPEWRVDTDFDLDHHLRFLRLAPPASVDRLFEFATRFIDDPFDRSRPLWQMVLVTGLPRGRAALITKAHHSIADGQGLVRLALNLFDLTRDAAEHAAPDLDEALAALGAGDDGSLDALTRTIASRIERVLGVVSEAAITMASPARDAAAKEFLETTRLFTGEVAEQPSVSPLWARRSRNRRSAHLSASLPEMTVAARAREVTVNDLFVAACADAAIAYHAADGVDLASLSAAVVVSTRTDDDPDAHNSFVPTGVVVPGVGATTEDRIVAIRRQIIDRRAQIAGRRRALDTAGRLAGLVPSSIAAATAVEHARKLDFGTSNLPGPPVPLWLAGSRVESLHPLGPVSGTAFNATLMSYVDDAAIGLHIDPAAVTDPARLAKGIRSSLARLDVSCRIVSCSTRSRRNP